MTTIRTLALSGILAVGGFAALGTQSANAQGFGLSIGDYPGYGTSFNLSIGGGPPPAFRHGPGPGYGFPPGRGPAYQHGHGGYPMYPPRPRPVPVPVPLPVPAPHCDAGFRPAYSSSVTSTTTVRSYERVTTVSSGGQDRYHGPRPYGW